jgi:hypothetical protein
MNLKAFLTFFFIFDSLFINAFLSISFVPKSSENRKSLNLKYMQKLKLINLLAVLLGLFLFGACEYATIEPVAPPPPPPPGDSTSFSLKVQPIFNSNCVLCHKGNTPPDLREGKSYQSLMTAEPHYVIPGNSAASELYTILLPGSSMAQYCNSTQRTTIKYWIDEGAKNN